MLIYLQDNEGNQLRDTMCWFTPLTSFLSPEQLKEKWWSCSGKGTAMVTKDGDRTYIYKSGACGDYLLLIEMQTNCKAHIILGRCNHDDGQKL